MEALIRACGGAGPGRRGNDQGTAGRGPDCGVVCGGRSGSEVVIVWRRSRSARMVNGELDTGQCLAVGKSPDTSIARSTPNAG